MRNTRNPPSGGRLYNTVSKEFTSLNMFFNEKHKIRTWLRSRLRRFHKTTSLLGSASRNHSSTPPLGGERTSLERETSYPQDAALARSGWHRETGSCGPPKRHDDDLAPFEDGRPTSTGLGSCLQCSPSRGVHSACKRRVLAFGFP